jgi:hypothetical protein
MTKNNTPPIIATWLGRNIKDLSKEELIEAVLYLGGELNRERESHKKTLEMLGYAGRQYNDNR